MGYAPSNAPKEDSGPEADEDPADVALVVGRRGRADVIGRVLCGRCGCIGSCPPGQLATGRRGSGAGRQLRKVPVGWNEASSPMLTDF